MGVLLVIVLRNDRPIHHKNEVILLVRFVIGSSAQQMSQANDPLAEKRCRLRSNLSLKQMSQLASAKRDLELAVGAVGGQIGA
jgi:hypothetical protein